MAGEHAGHRKRIIKKLESGDLFDHELLEVMLFAAMPRKNTNDLAHRLLNQFGSIYEVYSASIEELMRVPGVGESIAAHIRCTGIVYRKHFLDEKNRFLGKFESVNFAAYVKERYEGVDFEIIDVYMVGKSGEVVKRHRFTNQNETSAELCLADLSKLLAKEEPMGIVLVHNHPLGGKVGSDADDQMTLQCQFICSMHGVLLCDHLIYSPQGVYSYYLSGRLKKMSENYSVKSIAAVQEKGVKFEKKKG